MCVNSDDVLHALVTIPFILKSYILDNISAITAKYTHSNEAAINPAFQSIDRVDEALQVNEKRSFALRRDFILATGVKNAYQEYNYQGLKSVFDESVHCYIDWDAKYGHQSLVISDEVYNGAVYYAGFVCQREDYLEVFLSAGRFNRYERLEEGILPLSQEQTTILETYLVLQFFKAYGNQKIVFYDTFPGKQDEDDCALFFTDTPFPPHKERRIYTSESVSQAVDIAARHLNYGKAKEYIQTHIPPITPKYSYANEDNINPGYLDIEQVNEPLRLFEKRIWALRSDFILATGVKNAYQDEHGYNGLGDSFSESIQRFLNWQDRYGHPSLTIADEKYDGGVFYAGYVCQRNRYLQVYLASGRFDRKDLNPVQTKILEAYIAAQFQVAYGIQEIVFDFADPDNPLYHTIFFGNGLFSEDNPQRRYTQSSIREILGDVDKPEIAQSPLYHR
jgi:hypothetical protein